MTSGPAAWRFRLPLTGVCNLTGLAAKAQIGFAMYALPEDAARLRPAISDPEIMLDILSL
jgi:hypothetical protein